MTERMLHDGEEMTDELLLHEPDPNGIGGMIGTVFGGRLCGKTTFLLNAARKVKYKDADGNQWNETVIWRGRRGEDSWVSLPRDHTTVFIHKDDRNHITFEMDNDTIPPEKTPRIVTYRSCSDLYSKLKWHEYNIIYEPSQLPDDIKKTIRGIIGKHEKKFTDEMFDNLDESVFWFALLHWFIFNKDSRPLTIILDEVDELFPVSPAGIRWYLNLWAKEMITDCRKKNISLIMATHGYQDIDGRVLCKVMFKAYMNGVTTPTISLINKHAPLLLKRGMYYIERDRVGLCKLPEDMPPVKRVCVGDR